MNKILPKWTNRKHSPITKMRSIVPTNRSEIEIPDPERHFFESDVDINCQDTDRNVLLFELWNNSTPAAVFANVPELFLITPSLEELQYSSSGKIDYLCGRAIKTDFSNFPMVNPSGYNNKFGSGKFEFAFEKARNRSTIENILKFLNIKCK
ncbi:MAG: hypothetical protein JKX76_00915 [Colwellia sp.]|nr:hypothetical protein [Colwellia sp.]